MTAPYSPDNPFAQPKRPTYSPDNPFAASPDTPPLEAPLSVVTKRAHQGDAGLMAEAFVLSKRTGLPVQTVARRMNAVRDMAGDKDFAPGEFVKAHPATARWLTDEANATVSKDDWSNLGMIERLVGADWRVVGTGQPDMAQRAASFGATGGLGVGLPTATAQAAPRQRGLLRAEYDKEATVVELGRIGAIPPGQRDAALRARQAELEALRAVELPAPENFAERMLRWSAKFAPSIVESAKEGGVGAGVGAVVGGAVGALAGGAGAVPGAAFGAKAGGLLNTFRAAAEMEGGNAVLAFEKLTDANGNAVDPDLAYAEGMAVGVASGAVELVGLGFLAKPFAKVASPILRGGVSKAMQQATVGGALAAGAKAWGAAVAGETATEVIQQGLQLAGEAKLRLASNVLDDTDFDGIPLNRVARELFETGVETAIGMALIGIPGGAVVTVDGLARAAEANATRDRLTMLTESAAGSKLRERAPDQFKALLDQQIAEHGGARDVFIAVDRLQLLLQEQGVSPDEFVAVAGIAPEVYQQAVAMTGADVVIPLADFAARVVGTPLGDAMLEDVRVRQGAMSAREARQVEKDADAFYAPIREEMEALTVADVTEDEERFVVEDLTAKLEATGTYTPDQVRTMVEAAAKPYIVLGRRYADVNPARGVRWLYETRNLKIVAGQRADLLYSTARAIQRAVAEGKSPDAVSALRVRYNKLADERVQIRAAAESIEQTQGVRDEAGRLRKSLRFVSDESLVLEYISLRDQVSLAAGELAALESTPEVSAALQMNPEMTEDRTGAVEGLAFTVNVEGGFAGVEALMREARTLVRKYERTVPRLAAELAARGITDPDTYAAERDLLADASFDPEGMAFQRDLSPIERDVTDMVARQAALLRRTATALRARGKLSDAELARLADVLGTVPDLLEQNESRARRQTNAFILPGRVEQIIGLMETANLSSFLHEMGHEYLNLLAFVAEQPDAPQGVQDDLAVALKALGADSAASLTVAQQELWARSFEAYLKDGTAPSRPLLRAFTRFRIWLTDVYRAVVNVLPTVSPELRGVFDRLLATEDELAEMRRQPEATPLFTEAVAGVLTDAEYAAYQSAVAFRDATAGAQLARDLLAETNKERTAAWTEREADVREAVTALVDAAPVEKAVVYLRTGTLPDGTVQDAPVRLSKAALVERYGPGVTKTLPTKTFSVEGGMDADSAALLLGFDTGDALIDALQRYEPRAAKIERLVGSEMRRLFPDLLYDSPALADAAADAMHRTETDELLVLELKKLGKAVGTVAPNLVTVKQVARDIIGETAARDLSPYKFQQAERKAARLAEQAVRAQDWGRAEFHKRQQLLNHILYREARAAQERVGQVQRFFTRMAKGASQERMGKAGQHHREAMNEILDRYEFRDVSLRRMDRRASILDYVAQVAGEDLIALTMPEHVLRDAAVTNYRTLTMDQLEGVYESGKMIWHVVTKKDKLLAKMAKQTLTEQAEAVAAAIAEHRPLKPRQLDTRESPFQLAEEWRAKVDAWHLPPEFLFRWLDGDQPLGVVWDAFFRPMADAESAENTMLKEADAQMKALEAMVPESRKREFWDKEVTVPGLNARVKGRTIIAVALNWGSESNREAILASTVDGNAVWQSAGAVERALSLLTREELAYIQAKWDYLNTFWPEIKALEEAMVGVAPEKVESSPFTVRLADGTEVAMQGGYYPLKYDGSLSAKQSFLDAASLAEGVNEISPKGGARAQTRHGFTETRVGSGGKPVLLDLSVFNTHVINVIHDLTHRRAIMDVVRLYQRPEVEQAIVQSAGQPMYEAIRPWLVRIAQPDQTFDNSFAERLLSRARTGTTVVNMGFKVTTGVTQILGFTQSLDMIGPKWVSRGVAAFLSNPAKAWREVKAMSPEMENRRTNFNREVRDYAVSRKGKWARRDEFFFAFVGAMDMVVSVPTWIGAYRQSFETLAPGNHADAVAYADSVVRMSQSAGSPKDLARIQGGPELRRLLTMHYSFFSRLYGLMRRSGTNLREGRWGVPRFLASMTLLWFASATLSELLAGRWPEDDEEDGLERMAWEVLRYPASTVVGLRDVTRAVGPDRFDYKLTPAEDAFIQSARTLNVAYRATLGDFMDDETEFELSESDIKAMTLTAGYWGRLPSRQALITGGALYDWMMGYDAPEGVVDAARDLSFTRPR